MDTLPKDCAQIIFGYLTSYQRVLPCLVCERWCNIIIGMIPGYKCVRDMVANGDYLAMVRLKDLECINLTYAYESGDLDVIAYVQTWDFPDKYLGSIRGAVLGGHIDLLQSLFNMTKKLSSKMNIQRVHDIDDSITSHEAFQLAYKHGQYEIVEYYLNNFTLYDLCLGCYGSINIDVWTLPDQKMQDLIKDYNHCEHMVFIPSNGSQNCDKLCKYCILIQCEVFGRINNWDGINKHLQESDDLNGLLTVSLNGAYWGGHRDLIKKLLDISGFIHDQNYLFENACKHADILKELYHDYPNLYIDTNDALDLACEYNNYESVCIILDKAEEIENYDDLNAVELLEAACACGNIDILKRVAKFIKKADICGCNWFSTVDCCGMYEACSIIDELEFTHRDNTGSYKILQYSRECEIRVRVNEEAQYDD